MVFVFSIFLFDCNENRIEEFIVFLKKLFNDVILYNNGIIVEFVFFLEVNIIDWNYWYCRGYVNKWESLISLKSYKECNNCKRKIRRVYF